MQACAFVRDVHETLYVGPEAIVAQNTGKRQPLDIRIYIYMYNYIYIHIMYIRVATGM